jgi:hypothetical protein
MVLDGLVARMVRTMETTTTVASSNLNTVLQRLHTVLLLRTHNILATLSTATRDITDNKVELSYSSHRMRTSLNVEVSPCMHLLRDHPQPEKAATAMMASSDKSYIGGIQVWTSMNNNG